LDKVDKICSKISYIIILLLLALIPFYFDPMLEERFNFRYGKEIFFNIIILFLTSVFLVDLFNKSKPVRLIKKFTANPIYYPFLVLTLFSGLSLIKCSEFIFNFRDFVSLICGFLFFLIVGYYIDTQKRIDWCAQIILLTGLVMGFYCIFQYFGFDPIFPEGITIAEGISKGYKRVAGFIDNPNTLSSFLILIPLVALSDILRKKALSEKFIPLLALLLSITGILLARALAGIISIAVGLIIFLSLVLISKWGLKRKAIVQILSISVTLSILLIIVLFAITDMSEKINPDKSPRMLILKSSLYMMKENPILGIGFGNFKVKYLDYRIKAVGDSSFSGEWEYADYAHNDYFQLAAEAGIFAIFVVIWLLIVLIKITLLKVGEKGEIDYLFIGLIASLGTASVNALASFPMHLGASAVFVIFYAALVSKSVE